MRAALAAVVDGVVEAAGRAFFAHVVVVRARLVDAAAAHTHRARGAIQIIAPRPRTCVAQLAVVRVVLVVCFVRARRAEALAGRLATGAE